MTDKGLEQNVREIVMEYVNLSEPWRLKLAKMHPHIHFGELAAQVLNNRSEATTVMQEYITFLAIINEELQRPDRVDMYKDVSVPVATEFDGVKGTDGIKGAAEARPTGKYKALSRSIGMLMNHPRRR